MKISALISSALTLSACSAMSLNQDISNDLSTDAKVCIQGIKRLPYTNGQDIAYTSEGKVETCSTPASNH